MDGIQLVRLVSAGCLFGGLVVVLVSALLHDSAEGVSDIMFAIGLSVWIISLFVLIVSIL